MPGTLNGCNISTISEQEQSQPVTVYPNPFSSEINFSIYLARPDHIVVTIINSLGEEVMVSVVTQGVAGTNTVQIILPTDLPAGLYMMRVQSGEHTWTQSLIKSNQ